MLQSSSSLPIVCSFFSLACHSSGPPIAPSQTLSVSEARAGDPVSATQVEVAHPIATPRIGRLTEGVKVKLLECMSKPEPTEIEKRTPTWFVVVPPNERIAIAEKFVIDSNIPWDEVVVGPFGQVRRAILNDESKAISNEVDDNAWMDFWYGFLHSQTTINEPFGPINLPTPAKPHRRPHPHHGTVFSRWAGSVRVTGVSTQAGDRADFGADYQGRASEIWPNHIRLSHAELTCIREFSFPTNATVSSIHRACPQCNAEQRQTEITMQSRDVIWNQVPTLLSDGIGNYSARWTGLPMPLHAPHSPDGPRPTRNDIRWHDTKFSEFRTDVISGEHWVDTMCKRLPGGRLLFCAPSEKDVQAMIKIWTGATTTWTP